jgi:hypothetical protein
MSVSPLLPSSLSSSLSSFRLLVLAVLTLQLSTTMGCPRSTLVGAPCEAAGEEQCEDLQKLRCVGGAYQLIAPCHADCAPGPGVTHEQSSIDADETWLCADSPHLVRGVVGVAAGATLTIEPGSQVRLEPSSHVDVDVDGRVVIDASPGAEVVFTSNNELAGGFATAATGGLNVFATSGEPSLIRHLIVERGQNGLGVFGLSSTATPPVIERSTFRDNSLFGLRLSCDAVDSPVPDFAAAGNLFFANGDGDVSTCSPE